MTGRRLYDLVCDEWAKFGPVHRDYISSQTNFVTTPVAWPFLHLTEQKVWNAAARRIKGVRR